MIRFIDDEFKNIREDYRSGELLESDLLANPIEHLLSWITEAYKLKLPEPNTMVLSTVGENSSVSSRVVLLKAYDKDSLYFFTNYNSDKAQQIALNNNVSLLFFWPKLERQVRVQGTAVKTSRELSVNYFNKRPKNSRLGAMISSQSKVIAGREELESDFLKIQEKYQGEVKDCPEFWGGYQIRPEYYEFWQGRRSRLHDRLVYKLSDNNWENYRLSP